MTAPMTIPAMAPDDNLAAAVTPVALLGAVLLGALVVLVELGVLDAVVKNTLLVSLSALNSAGNSDALGHIRVAQGLVAQHPKKGGFMFWHVYQRALSSLHSCGVMSSYLSAENEALRKSPRGHNPDPSAQGFVVQHPRNWVSLSWQM